MTPHAGERGVGDGEGLVCQGRGAVSKEHFFLKKTPKNCLKAISNFSNKFCAYILSLIIGAYIYPPLSQVVYECCPNDAYISVTVSVTLR